MTGSHAGDPSLREEGHRDWRVAAPITVALPPACAHGAPCAGFQLPRGGRPRRGGCEARTLTTDATVRHDGTKACGSGGVLREAEQDSRCHGPCADCQAERTVNRRRVGAATGPGRREAA